MPAVLPSAGHYPTRPRRDTSFPNSPALFEAGVGSSGPGDKKKVTEREQAVVLLVGWFPLAVSSVLTAVFCCGGETALPSPWTTLCQQEGLTHEIKCNIWLKWLKWLNKEKRFPCAWVQAAANTNISISTFLLSKINNKFSTRIKQSYS